MTEKNGRWPAIKINPNITEALLEEYETQLFDVNDVRGGGAHRYVNANVQAAWDAGWLVNEPVEGFDNGKWKETKPSPERYKYFSDIVKAVDKKYRDFTVIDPNG